MKSYYVIIMILIEMITSASQVVQNKLKNNNFENKENIKSNEYTETEIESIDTSILINNNESDGTVTEIIRFKVPSKIPIKSIKRSISLEGTSAVFSNFRLISSNVKLKHAKVINNCEGKNEIINFHKISSYLCLIAEFEEVILEEPQNYITIGYEYNAIHLLKKREKPFSNLNEEENVLIFMHSNFSKYLIPEASLSVKIVHDHSKVINISLYPEKLTEVNFLFRKLMMMMV